MPESTIDTLSPKDVRTEIRFALGQAGASLFIGAHAKSPEARQKAIEALTDLVAQRFDGMSVTRVLKDGWRMP